MEKLNESDEELLKGYKWARDYVPDDVTLRPDPNEFEKIWRGIQEERSRP